MPDAQSLPGMIRLHEQLYGSGALQSIATDKGYYSFDNERLLLDRGVSDIQLPRPEHNLNAPEEKMPWLIRKSLHDRRAGIEPLISHTKHGGQMGKSRMKSDETTRSAGYAAVFVFNLRQFTRYLTGEVRPNIEDVQTEYPEIYHAVSNALDPNGIDYANGGCFWDGNDLDVVKQIRTTQLSNHFQPI